MNGYTLVGLVFCFLSACGDLAALGTIWYFHREDGTSSDCWLQSPELTTEKLQEEKKSVGLRGKDSGTLVGTRTAVCVGVGAGAGGCGRGGFMEQGHSRATSTNGCSGSSRSACALGSCRSPLCVSTCTPERWTRPQRSASWSCASEHGSFLVHRRLEGVAEPWFNVCPPPHPGPSPPLSLLPCWGHGPRLLLALLCPLHLMG